MKSIRIILKVRCTVARHWLQIKLHRPSGFMEPDRPSTDGSYQQWLRIHRMYSTGSASLQAEAKSFVAGSWFCMWSFLYGLIFLMPFIFAYHNISVGLTCEGIGQEFYW